MKYPLWKKTIWRYVRIFVASFGVAFPFDLLVQGNNDLLWSAAKAALIAGVAAIFKALRENKDYDSLLHKLPI